MDTSLQLVGGCYVVRGMVPLAKTLRGIGCVKSIVDPHNYERIDARGLHVSFGEDRKDPTLIEADTIVLCAGQLSERSLADKLAEAGITAHVIGGADVAAELDAKRFRRTDNGICLITQPMIDKLDL